MEADVIEAGIDAFPDRVDVGLEVGTHGRILRRLLERDVLDGGGEVGGAAELLEEPAPKPSIGQSSWMRRRPASGSGPQQTSSSMYLGLPAPPASSNVATVRRSGLVA